MPKLQHVELLANQIRFALLTIIFVALSISNYSFASMSVTPGNISTNYEILEAAFGLVKADDDGGHPILTPTTEVPLVPYQGYGWVIRLRTPRQTVKWREEFTLPAKPTTWGESDNLNTQSVSENGLTSNIEREVSSRQGEISHAWQVAPGDPPGKYVIRIYIDGVLAKTFEFRVE